jgi:hypothetical protein
MKTYSMNDSSMIRRPTGRFMLCALLLLGTVVMLSAPRAQAADAAASCKPPICRLFQAPDAFLAEAFNGAVPAPQVLNLDAAAQSRISAVFGRAFPQTRVRYWAQDGRTAWIFDDIGKQGYQPTTSGFVVREGGQIDVARVLIYKESRGEQVGDAAFLTQLAGAKARGSDLDVPVDNIAGATLSVKMMVRMARTAIELDALTR